MSTMAMRQQVRVENRTDDEVVALVLQGDTALFEVLMRRYNQRLFRVVRSIIADDGEAEDVLEDSYVLAYQHLAQFKGASKFSTWLTRIAVRASLARRERRCRFESIGTVGAEEDKTSRLVSSTPNPEEYASMREATLLLKAAIQALPEKYRAVLMMRDIEGMSVEETADCLEISKVNVKVRLHRARALVRRELYSRAGAKSSAAFEFLGLRCDRVVKAVLERLTRLEESRREAPAPT
jgi:RNA polymerase sigma-70 factor (ECF subfamily)